MTEQDFIAIGLAWFPFVEYTTSTISEGELAGGTHFYLSLPDGRSVGVQFTPHGTLAGIIVMLHDRPVPSWARDPGTSNRVEQVFWERTAYYNKRARAFTFHLTPRDLTAEIMDGIALFEDVATGQQPYRTVLGARDARLWAIGTIAAARRSEEGVGVPAKPDGR